MRGAQLGLVALMPRGLIWRKNLISTSPWTEKSEGLPSIVMDPLFSWSFPAEVQAFLTEVVDYEIEIQGMEEAAVTLVKEMEERRRNPPGVWAKKPASTAPPSSPSDVNSYGLQRNDGEMCGQDVFAECRVNQGQYGRWWQSHRRYRLAKGLVYECERRHLIANLA